MYLASDTGPGARETGVSEGEGGAGGREAGRGGGAAPSHQPGGPGVLPTVPDQRVRLERTFIAVSLEDSRQDCTW